MQSVKYLEQLRAERGLKTDGEVAEVLGISRGAVNHYSTGRRIMDDEACLAVAIALGLDEHQTMRVLMAAGIDRAEKAGQKSLWSVFSQRMGAVAASTVLAVSVTGFLTPQNAEARTYGPTSISQEPTNLYYVKYDVDKLPSSRLAFQ